jgi:hypothetical protein
VYFICPTEQWPILRCCIWQHRNYVLFYTGIPYRMKKCTVAVKFTSDFLQGSNIYKLNKIILEFFVLSIVLAWTGTCFACSKGNNMHNFRIKSRMSTRFIQEECGLDRFEDNSNKIFLVHEQQYIFFLKLNSGEDNIFKSKQEMCASQNMPVYINYQTV